MPSRQQSRQSSQSSTQFVPGALGVYHQNVKLHMNNYRNIQQGYRQGQQTLAGNLNKIYSGYSTLQNQVAHTLGVDGGGWGVATPGAQAIAQGFARQQGVTQQSMIDRGLGNTTVLAGESNANQLNAAQAYGGLASQLADKFAGYQSQIGQSGLDAQLKGAGLQSNLAQSYLGDLSNFRFADFAPQTGNFSSSQGTSDGQSFDSPVMGGRGGGGPGNPGEPYFGANIAKEYGYAGDQGDPWGDASRAAHDRVDAYQGQLNRASSQMNIGDAYTLGIGDAYGPVQG